MEITLSLPPTTNHTYHHAGHTVYMVREAKDWQNEAILRLKKFRGEEPTQVCITYYLKRDRDVDGSHKIILDSMQKAGVVKNDSSIIELCLTKYKTKGEPYVEILSPTVDEKGSK